MRPLQDSLRQPREAPGIAKRSYLKSVCLQEAGPAKQITGVKGLPEELKAWLAV